MTDVRVFVDGSGTVASGPACIGVVLFEDGAPVLEASAYVGQGSNNVAELVAIRRGLYLLEQRYGLATPATLYSDSSYAIGVVSNESWNASTNEALVRAARQQRRRFRALALCHVDGHAGIMGNEIADWLAGEARARWFASQGLASTKRRPPRPDEPKPPRARKADATTGPGGTPQ